MLPSLTCPCIGLVAEYENAFLADRIHTVRTYIGVQVRKKLKDLDRLPDASPALTCVEDLMHLERKLEELGLTQGSTVRARCYSSQYVYG
jgi:hypothetical protein